MLCRVGNLDRFAANTRNIGRANGVKRHSRQYRTRNKLSSAYLEFVVRLYTRIV